MSMYSGRMNESISHGWRLVERDTNSQCAFGIERPVPGAGAVEVICDFYTPVNGAGFVTGTQLKVNAQLAIKAVNAYGAMNAAVEELRHLMEQMQVAYEIMLQARIRAEAALSALTAQGITTTTQPVPAEKAGEVNHAELVGTLVGKIVEKCGCFSVDKKSSDAGGRHSTFYHAFTDEFYLVAPTLPLAVTELAQKIEQK